MRKIKRTFKILLCFCIVVVGLASCNDKEEFATRASQTEGVNKEAILVFSSKEDIMQAVKDGGVSTRAVVSSPNTDIVDATLTMPEILSLTDKVQANDPILNEVSTEEKQIILSEGMTYYEMFGCEEYIPSPNFAKLLNSKREIQLNDSVYKITEFGTLRANQLDREKLEMAYETVKADTTITLADEDFISVVEGVDLHPYKEVIVEQGEAPLLTRTVAEDIPTSVFKHYTTKSKTVIKTFPIRCTIHYA